MSEITRTPEEVGELVRARRRQLGLAGQRLASDAGVGIALVYGIERGTAPSHGQPERRRALMEALGWPRDALDQLAQGADPATLDRPGPEPIQLSSSGTDLERLRREAPRVYAALEGQARAFLEEIRRDREADDGVA